MTVSMRVSRQDYEKAFGTELSKFQVDPKIGYQTPSFYFPAQGAPWQPALELASLLDDAYIQWPHIYMDGPAAPSATSPPVDYYCLEMPSAVPTLLNATKVHNAGVTGKGVRVVMVDSGFAHVGHPFFAKNGFTSTVDLAPGAKNDSTDLNGHGTAESTNVFAVAPGATFIGVKVDSDDPSHPGASLLEGFQTAIQQRPQVISISMGYDLRDENGQLGLLPNSLAALEAEIQAAVASGVIIVFSAGNGHFSFPGMMPDVISAGGVFVDQNGNMQASDYASAFASKIYSGRSVPDFCGLVGMLPHATYIMLPTPAGSATDHETATPSDGATGDGTTPSDGWSVLSGTSAAAPQLAGVCALLLEKNPALTPGDVKTVLRRTARTVSSGHANPSSSDDMGTPVMADSTDHGAAGAGLVDAFAALQQV
jgi:subtilisin family serine protease